MSDNQRSFWSTIPGLVTGLAGLLTGIVGLVTVLIQLNVIGGGSSNKTAATEPAPAAGGITTTAPVAGGNASTATTGLGSFSLSPKPLTFGPTDPTVKTITVTNMGTAPITLKPPTVTGDNADQFSAAFDSCTSAPIIPGLSCTLKVTFKPGGPLGSYKATLQVAPATGAVRGDEVPLTASTLLGR